LGDDKIVEGVHARHIAEHDLIMLALAEVFDGVIGSDCHRRGVLEDELILAALSVASQWSVSPHIVGDRGTRCSGPSDQDVVAALACAGQKWGIAV